MDNNLEGGKISFFLLLCIVLIVILGIFAYLSLSRFSSLGITPINIGLRPDGSDLARVMYETGTLIVCLATLILAVTAFVVPFTIHLWSEMSDSFFSLFIQTIDHNGISNNSRNRIIRKIQDVISEFSQVQENVRTILQMIVVVCVIAMILLSIIAIGVIFCWNIVQYLWLRALLFIICIVIALGLFFLLRKFMKVRPEITKRNLQMIIINELLKKPGGRASATAGQQKAQKDKKNAEKEK